jgi:hypothetical protein
MEATMKRSQLFSLFCTTFSLLNICVSTIHAAGTWETTLEARDFDGNPATIEGYYDSVLAITWLADANLAASNTFGLPYNTDLGMHPNDSSYPTSTYSNIIQETGAMDWGAALHWIDAMNATNYLGYSGWRLPTMMDTGAPGCDFSYAGGTDCGYNVQTGSADTIVYSEMASMFHDTLGNLAYYDTSGGSGQPGWGLSNTGPFSNIQPSPYWSGLEYVPNPYTGTAWLFVFRQANQGGGGKSGDAFAWAVHTGDIGTAVTVDDFDGDGIPDDQDNCSAAVNYDQRDTDGDGYGSLCDGDLNNDGATNTLDLNLYKLAHRTTVGDANYNPDADFNGDGTINTLDLNIYKGLHRKPPGPSCCGVF